jgi:hypothetical protein
MRAARGGRRIAPEEFFCSSFGVSSTPAIAGPCLLVPRGSTPCAVRLGGSRQHPLAAAAYWSGLPIRPAEAEWNRQGHYSTSPHFQCNTPVRGAVYARPAWEFMPVWYS